MTCLLCNHETAPVIVNRVARNGTPQISVSCARCGFVQADPMPTAEQLREYYASGAYRLAFPALPVDGVEPTDPGYDAAVQRRAEEGAAAILQLHALSPGAKVHEVGCGDGRVAAKIGATAWDMDPGQRALAEARGVRLVERPEGCELVYALQVLEHQADPVAALVEWRGYLMPEGGRLHVQVPTLERMYGGAGHFFQWPHVVNFTRRTLAIALLRAGYSPTGIGLNGNVLWATAEWADSAVSYDAAVAMLADKFPAGRDDVPALIASHEASRPKPTLVDQWLAYQGDTTDFCEDDGYVYEEGYEACEAWRARELALRAEVSTLRDAYSLLLESVAKLSNDYHTEAVRVGEQWAADPYRWGEACGRSRELEAASATLGTLANAMMRRRAP